MFSIVAVPLDAFRTLPSAQDRWLLTCFSAYVDKAGRAFCSLRQLVRDARMSLPTVSRRMAAMAALGVFQRERKPGGRYHYVLAEPYRPRWPGKANRGVSATARRVSHAETQQAKLSKQKADARAGETPAAMFERLKWQRRLQRASLDPATWRDGWGPLSAALLQWPALSEARPSRSAIE